jgi:hypothetical protein
MSQQINEINIEEYDREITSDEYFTPPELIQKHIQGLDPNKSFIDNNAGIGNWLVELLEWKISQGIDKEIALTQLYGVELNLDTHKIMVERLLCGQEQYRHIVEKNIVCSDALRYHYRFDGSHPYDDETQAQKKEDHLNTLFSFE